MFLRFLEAEEAEALTQVRPSCRGTVTAAGGPSHAQPARV